MENRMEELQTRGELALWSARKEAHRLRIDGLQEKMVSEREDVEEMENGGLFTRLRNLGRFESNLGKEIAEADAVQEELENVETILQKAERNIIRLQRRIDESVRGEIKEADGKEQELLDWVKGVELAWKTASENNACIEYGRTALQELRDGRYDTAGLPAFGERVNSVYRLTEDFLRSVGVVKVISGIKQKTWRSSFYVNGGKTLVFLQNEKPVRELKVHSFDFTSLRNALDVEEALLWTVFDLEALKVLFAELVEEKVDEGEKRFHIIGR